MSMLELQGLIYVEGGTHAVHCGHSVELLMGFSAKSLELDDHSLCVYQFLILTV